MGETTITRETSERVPATFRVSKNGKADELFASGRSGSEKVKWTQSHMRYGIRLSEGNAHEKLLGQVEVRPTN